MQIINEVHNMVNDLCNKHMGSISYNVEFSNRFTNYLGKCIYDHRKNHCTLRFSTRVFNSLYKENNVEQIKDTVLHEIAHAQVNRKYGRGHNHDWVWQQVAKSLGCSARVTSTIKSEYKYIYECPCCHNTWKVNRKYSKGVHCSKCYKKYGTTREHELVILKVNE